MAAEGDTKIATCQFSKDKEVYVMWGENDTTVNFGTGKIQITDIYGNETIGHAQAIPLKEVPIFVERVAK
jgi:hypothetical protein